MRQNNRTERLGIAQFAARWSWVLIVVLGLPIGLLVAMTFPRVRLWLWAVAVFVVPAAGLISYYRMWKRETWRETLHSSSKPLRLFGFSVLASLAAAYVDKGLQAQEPRVFRIVLLGEKGLSHWESFKKGFRFARTEVAAEESRDPAVLCSFSFKSASGELAIVNVEPQDIAYTGDRAQDAEELKAGISSLTADPDVLMLIGFVTSTKADEALRSIEETDQVKHLGFPAVILPMATDSSLLREHNRRSNRPFLRLVPANRKQVEPMARRLRALKETGVSLAIFRDRSNARYSSDLAAALRQKVQGQVSVVFDGGIGPDGPGTYVTDSLIALSPDCVAFLGMLETAVPLVRQIKRMSHKHKKDGPGWDPLIVLSDGSVESELNGFAEREELRGVVGFFPYGEANKERLQALGHAANGLTGPSFGTSGFDSAVFASEILGTAFKEGVLNRESVGRAVRTVAAKCNKDEESKIRTAVLGGPYHFDQYGDVESLDYYMWTFNGGQWILGASK